MDFTAISRRIAETFPRLSPRLQRAARYVLDKADDVGLMSRRRLAAGAGVHPSTMVRLARAFDFDSYGGFREPFQQRLGVCSAGSLERARDLQARGAGGATSKLIADFLSTDGANLHEAFDANGGAALVASAGAMAAARRLYVVGLGGCFPVAFLFHYVYCVFRGNAVLLDGRGGTFAEDLRTVGAGDVMFAISVEPDADERVRAVGYTKCQGGSAVVLTDSLVSPLAKNADHVLIVRTESASFFHSMAPLVGRRRGPDRAHGGQGRAGGARAHRRERAPARRVRRLLAAPGADARRPVGDAQGGSVMSRIFARVPGAALPKAARGDGVYIVDTEGKRYIDASGGAAVSCLGHSDAEVRRAIKAQLDALAYAHTAFFTSQAAEDLAELMIGDAPEGIEWVYFLSGGSESIEAALKMARQYFVDIGEPGRRRFIARRQSYHGNTLGALAVGGNPKRRAPFTPLLFDVTHISPCYAYRGMATGESEEAYGRRVADELDAAIREGRPGDRHRLRRRDRGRRDLRRRAAGSRLLQTRPRHLRPPWRAPDPGRGDERHGSHRDAPRLRAGGDRAGPADCGQGPRRRLPADRRRAGLGKSVRRPVQGQRFRAARPHLHRTPDGLRRGARRAARHPWAPVAGQRAAHGRSPRRCPRGALSQTIPTSARCAAGDCSGASSWSPTGAPRSRSIQISGCTRASSARPWSAA